MSPTIKTYARRLVAEQLGRFLSETYSRGKGPASRLISISSELAQEISEKHDVVIRPVPIKKAHPTFSLDGKVENEYRNKFFSGADFTNSAGVITAKDVDISLPTGMHQVGQYTFNEVIPAPWVLTQPRYFYGLKSLRFKRKQMLDEAVLLSMPWHRNFYHWMIEILPRLVSFDRSPSLHHLPLVLPKSAPQFVAESLKLAGYKTQAAFLENGAYRFKTLHMLSVLSKTTEVSPDAVVWLNTKLSNVSHRADTPKRIYVSRKDADLRFVSNEAQLTDVLAEFGFETLIMSELSLTEQIGIFRSAECIIGPHGAAFANLAFAKENSTFIEFFDRRYYAPCFNRIAAIRNLKYGFLVGEPTRYGGFSINPSRLQKLLAQAL